MTAAFFRTLARDAARRYPARDRYARHFAFGKLTGDPAFRHLLEQGLIPRSTEGAWVAAWQPGPATVDDVRRRIPPFTESD